MKKRETNYDLLRIISTFAVILIHVNATVLNSGEQHQEYENVVMNIINIITRFSVPCFVMLSGAFLLSNPKNKNYKYFYAKTFYNVGIPFLIALVILLSISILKQIVIGANPLDPAVNAIKGTFCNLWYIYMLVGLYVITPVIIRIKEEISRKAFSILSVVWLFFAIISQTTTTYDVAYSFGVIFSYAGYFMIGNVIYENKKKNNNNNPALFLLFSVLMFATAYIYRTLTGDQKYSISPYTSFFSPFVVLASVFIFIAFANIKVTKSFGKLPEKTYIIYLYHTFVYLTIFSVFEALNLELNNLVVIAVIWALTFITAWVISTVYLKIWSIIEKKFLLKEKWFKRFSK